MGTGFFSGGFGLLVALFLAVLAILWFLLPFAIFGIKDRLERSIAATRESNEKLDAILAELRAGRMR